MILATGVAIYAVAVAALYWIARKVRGSAFAWPYAFVLGSMAAYAMEFAAEVQLMQTLGVIPNNQPWPVFFWSVVAFGAIVCAGAAKPSGIPIAIPCGIVAALALQHGIRFDEPASTYAGLLTAAIGLLCLFVAPKQFARQTTTVLGDKPEVWPRIVVVCAFATWVLSFGIYVLTLYLAYLTSFPALLFALTFPVVAQLYWIWVLRDRTGTFFHFLTLLCFAWLVAGAAAILASIRAEKSSKPVRSAPTALLGGDASGRSRNTTEWSASADLIARVRASIRPVQTDKPLREVLTQDFPRDCSNLPISGGWAYTQADAIMFVRDQLSVPRIFASFEYHISRKIIYEELIIHRPEDYRFSGIDLQLIVQKLIKDSGRQYDLLKFNISCWSDWHWDQLKQEWEENDFGRRPGFDREAHAAKRDASQVKYERDFWFDITDVFHRG